ncbi:MAG: hypothetical protein HRT94_09070 [Alphaproteobacteria bacterium]|nr:hypothetical protein [Alphaproteobacteria bacterium]
MTKEQIIQQLQDVSETIDQAQNDIAAGLVRDLSHLDNHVAQICNDIVNLSPEDAAQVQPIMADMISKLEALASSLQTFKSQMK